MNPIHVVTPFLKTIFFNSFYSNFVCTSCLSHASRMNCQQHPLFFDLIILIIYGEQYKLWSSSFCSFLHLLVTFPILGTNILPYVSFSNNLNPCSSLRVKDQVSQPYKTIGTFVTNEPRAHSHIYLFIYIYADLTHWYVNTRPFTDSQSLTAK